MEFDSMANVIGRGKMVIKNRIEHFFGVCNLDGHFIVNSLDGSSLIVDLGAGKGEFPENVLKIYPSCRIILVEPDPSLFSGLAKKYEKQNNIEVLNAVVIGNDKNNGARKFYLGKNPETNSLYRSLIEETNFQGEITVRAVTLDDVFSLFHLEKIDVLKVDVEGEEWNIFENFSEFDFERISQISVEFHDFIGPSLRIKSERCVKLLREFGYTVISRGTNFRYGSPYFSCLFYDKKRLKWMSAAKWWKIPKQLSDRI
jgi:FkbM family methyltransferase